MYPLAGGLIIIFVLCLMIGALVLEPGTAEQKERQERLKRRR